ILEDWDPEFGDRLTHLVFIGTNLDEESITKELDQCQLTEYEFDSDWSLFDEPFKWKMKQ
ncbi:GTP-binding protein, partial [Bacillus vallismortis]|nr:GTP-binding protein [Bacillus vallismortis]